MPIEESELFDLGERVRCIYRVRPPAAHVGTRESTLQVADCWSRDPYPPASAPLVAAVRRIGAVAPRCSVPRTQRAPRGDGAGRRSAYSPGTRGERCPPTAPHVHWLAEPAVASPPPGRRPLRRRHPDCEQTCDRDRGSGS